MKIASVKAIRDSPVGFVQNSGSFPHRPIARQRPIVELQSRRHGVDLRLVQYCAAARCKILGALITYILLRRLQAAPIRGGLRAASIDRNQVMTDAAYAGLGQ